jgi:hypothetical protein
MANSLGLDDDLDPVEVVIGIEKVFGVKITDNEACALLTVGQMYDLLLKKVWPAGAGRKCASAMAFYRLRRALTDLRQGEKQAPVSDLALLERGRTRKNWKRLEKASGLRLPRLAVARSWPLLVAVSIMGSAIPVVLTGLVLTFFSISLGDCLVALAPALLLGGLVLVLAASVADPGRLPDDCRTLGKLAKRTAARNYGQLIVAGAAVSEAEIWHVMIEVFGDLSNVPAAEITRETYFLQSQLDKVCQQGA